MQIEKLDATSACRVNRRRSAYAHQEIPSDWINKILSRPHVAESARLWPGCLCQHCGFFDGFTRVLNTITSERSRIVVNSPVLFLFIFPTERRPGREKKRMASRSSSLRIYANFPSAHIDPLASPRCGNAHCFSFLIFCFENDPIWHGINRTLKSKRGLFFKVVQSSWKFPVTPVRSTIKEWEKVPTSLESVACWSPLMWTYLAEWIHYRSPFPYRTLDYVKKRWKVESKSFSSLLRLLY